MNVTGDLSTNSYTKLVVKKITGEGELKNRIKGMSIVTIRSYLVHLFVNFFCLAASIFLHWNINSVRCVCMKKIWNILHISCGIYNSIRGQALSILCLAHNKLSIITSRINE